MPKRVKSHKSISSNKKARQPVNSSKRTSIPRNCKSTSPKSNKDKSIADWNKHMGNNQVKEEIKDVKNDKDEDSDGLDVVFDVQEEKKNKIYEVITVMSDDETPNTISYERIYAEDPAKRYVDASEVTERLNGNSINGIGKTNGATSKDCNNSDTLNADKIVSDVVDEMILMNKSPFSPANLGNESMSISEEPSISVNLNDNKSDSDSDSIVCLAVIDAKTKEEQKKQRIEEICLSSDSDSERMPTVPPLKLKLPVPRPYYRYLERKRNPSYGPNTFTFPQIYPFSYNNFANFGDIDSNSSSPKMSSSDELSRSPTSNSQQILTDESSSSVVSEEASQAKTYINDSDSSSSSSSEKEDGTIYWKENRETRRKNQLRYEEFTDLGKKIHEGQLDVDPATSMTFKVMSYNVLAQYLLEQHRYLYKNHDRRALVWERRWNLLYEEIKEENPEILCLQEVELGHLSTHYAKFMDLGYRWVFKKRTSSKNDGVAIFYKTALFEVVAQTTVEYHQPGVSVLDRDNVGIVLRLQLKSSPASSFVVATTHLLYNPKRGDVKLAQAQVLLAEIDRIAYNKDSLSYYPIILTGDFNLHPYHGVYKLIVEGQLNYEGMSRKSLLHRDGSNIVPKKLLPSRMGITDRCQHADVVEGRIRGEYTDKSKLFHSENNRDTPVDPNENEDSEKDDRFESGSLYHSFNFQSVYGHMKADERKEASTHHDKWITVDYIFYSVPKVKESQKKEEGALQLLSRLRLPTQDECASFIRHIPNFAFGSDHLPLVGKFLLRLQ